MCCQIVARKSVAPSSGDFRRRPAPRYVCWQDQEIHQWIFKGYLFFFCLAGLAGGPQLKIWSNFFYCFQNKKSTTLWWLVIKRKKFCLVKRYYCDFFLIRYLIWRYAELNHLLVGTSQIPLNIELQQDVHTVCFSHKIVMDGSVLAHLRFPMQSAPTRFPESGNSEVP